MWQAADDAAEIAGGRFILRRSAKLKGILPDWYQTAFQSRERIEALKRERDQLMHDGSTARLRELSTHLYALDAVIRCHIAREDRFLLPALNEPVVGRA